jgi:Peroxiredoxin
MQGDSDMATVTLAGNPVTVNGDFPQTGTTAKPFSLVNKELSDVARGFFQR